MDMPPQPMHARLSAVRHLAAAVAAEEDLGAQLAALASAALELTGFGCGQTYTYEHGLWVGHGGAQCPNAASCNVCNTDPRFTAFADETVVLDRHGAHAAMLADTPPSLAKVLVTPVAVAPDRRTVLVLRSDDPRAEVDAFTLELVHLLTAHAALAIEHARAVAAEREQSAQLSSEIARAHALARTLSDQVRDPLNTISAAATLLLDPSVTIDGGQADALVESMRRQAGYLSATTEHIALGALGDAEDLALRLADVPVVDLLRAALAVARQDTVSTPVTVHVDASLVVRADAHRAQQVLLHLVHDARRHGAGGGPVHVTAVSGGPTVAIDVQDEGPPIPSSARERIFERLVHGRPGTPDRGGGPGLYLARRFARAMGGDVTLLDGPGPCTFRLTLPAAASDSLSRRTSLATPDVPELRLTS